jgi:hypothetical protein
VPLQPDIVLSKLDVQLHMPIPATLLETLWNVCTPSSVLELETK